MDIRPCLCGLEIIDVVNRKTELCNKHREQAARILHRAFSSELGHPTVELALSEVDKLHKTACCLLLALLCDEVVGLVGALSAYRGATWELHPLAVREDLRGRGIGCALVRALEKHATDSQVCTIKLGSDDIDRSTTLGGKPLFPGVLAHISGIRNLKNHPFEFYQKLGYEIVGVIPDANGPGMPDIWMAKVLRP